jgi:hypothetical protein
MSPLGGAIDVVNRRPTKPLLRESILRDAIDVSKNPAQRLRRGIGASATSPARSSTVLEC